MRGLTAYSQAHVQKLSAMDNFGYTFKSLRDKRRREIIHILTSLHRFYPLMQWLQKTQVNGILSFQSGSRGRTRVRVWVANTDLQRFNQQRQPVVMSQSTCSKIPYSQGGLRSGNVYDIRKIGQSSLNSRLILWSYYDLLRTGKAPKNNDKTLDVKRLSGMNWRVTT